MALAVMGWLLLPLALVAFHYATVGHAGASGYIAVLALAGLPAAQIKPLALLLNLVVATQGSWHFIRAGHLRWRLFWLVLLASAVRFAWQPRDPPRWRQPPLMELVLSGAGLGLLAGFTGSGGVVVVHSRQFPQRPGRPGAARRVRCHGPGGAGGRGGGFPARQPPLARGLDPALPGAGAAAGGRSVAGPGSVRPLTLAGPEGQNTPRE
ncbi:MAG: hypothetical protein VKN13_00030 [Cyanobacteriota bacterium]|nr:hypothetical protein [Cyanobacteriota bacterium]